jgi:putative transcriptional regulator
VSVRFRLKEILNEKGMSERQLAELTGIRPNTINDICRNQLQRLHVDVIDKICRVLDVKPGDWIMYISEEE